MLSGEVIAAFIVLFGAFLYVYIPIVVGFTVLCIFTICVLIIGAGAVILAHITLSPVRRTGSGVEYIQKELHQFQNKLLVSAFVMLFCFVCIIKDILPSRHIMCSYIKICQLKIDCRSYLEGPSTVNFSSCWITLYGTSYWYT